MTYEIYRYIFIVAAILCGAMFITSILLFILLKIPRVIGDLSGSTARKAIEQIRNQNESTGEKTYKSSTVNRQRSKLTDKISPSGNLIRKQTDDLTRAMATEKIGTSKLGGNETTVLDSGNETTVLGSADETTVLAPSDETTVLSEIPTNTYNEVSDFNSGVASQNVFAIEYEITYIHTGEEIYAEAN